MANKTPKTLTEKLVEFQGEGIAFEKNAVNPFFKSKYTTLDDLNHKIKPILSNLGVYIGHVIKEGVVTTTLTNASNPEETISSSLPIPENITDPQKIGSAITYFKRYNTVALLNLDSESDDDGNSSKSPPKKKEKPVFGEKELKAMKQAIVDGKYEPPKTIEELTKEIKQKYTIKDDALLKTLYT